MKLTVADERALALLMTFSGLVGPGHFGDIMWGVGNGTNGYRGSACSAPYARQAGKVLNRLKSAGLAEWVHEGSSWGWRVTGSGKRYRMIEKGSFRSSTRWRW